MASYPAHVLHSARMAPEAPKRLQPAMPCPDCSKIHPIRAGLIPSPFESVIAQQSWPTALETAAIRDFTRDIDAEMAWRELAVDRLLCELAELRRRSEQHKALIAPIRRVPPEIMAEIFLQLTAIGAEERYPFAYNSYNRFKKERLIRPILHAAPLIFREISREWRDIALSVPSLWNSLSLTCTNDKIQSSISLCDMWLKRSGSLPLSIQIYRPYHRDAVPQEVVGHYQDLLRVILPYAERWRLFHLSEIPLSCDRILRDLLPESVPILEDLGVSHHTESADSTPWEGLRTAPKLRVLYFDTICGTEAGQWLSFPWSHLTHIDVRRCSVYDYLHILRAASAAVVCAFTVELDSSSDHSPVSHSGLQTLKIENRLTCPQLSLLEIETEQEPSTPHGGLPSFIARSGATIQNFSLSGTTLNDTEFMACLSGMPQLRHLDVSEFSSSQFTNEVWESLTWRPDSPSPLIPDLESLHFAGGNNCSHEAVAQMLESRVRSDKPSLKTVYLSFFRNASDSVWERFVAFQKLGLNITLDMTFAESDEGSEISDAEIGGSDSDAESGDSEDYGDSEGEDA
ncbi:hypothetical protein DFH08DRAFT_998659 [Mycena albidolilacea]|uniref:F-box domain-containing protein n=1 Tax=Mycena albidolilacea TaxID=1033008 RepID=A0AAD7ESY6_9AGAR|nr:hypothetical protein DFH08DRAFT_998659 [Mycena albidolilacea]